MGKPFFNYEHFEYICNHLKDGIFIANSDGIAVWINDTSTKQLGVPRSEVLGRHVKDLEKQGLFTPSVTRSMLEKKQTISKVQTSMNRQYLSTGYVVKVPDEDTEYFLVQVKDITETVKSSLKLEKAESLLQKYMDEVRELKMKQQEKMDKQTIIGSSKKHEEMLDLIQRVAKVDTTILLQGETGVGKSLVAEEIHRKSNRSEKPFMQINCGAIPESLLESELFGYKKGAFTGANQSGKVGLVEKADGGTLFLDEIAELPIALQPKILQLVQNKSFIPIGATELKTVDVRIITATNEDLMEMVQEKKFRSDLYYRLNVVSIHIPPLRDRKEDIIPLVYHYFDMYKNIYRKKATMQTDLLDFLQTYSWPGNIRELENMIERIIVTSTSDEIDISALPEQVLQQPEHDEQHLKAVEEQSLPEYLEQIEKTIIEHAKNKHDSTRKAAKHLGLTQSSYMRRLKKYNL